MKTWRHTFPMIHRYPDKYTKKKEYRETESLVEKSPREDRTIPLSLDRVCSRDAKIRASTGDRRISRLRSAI